jgi:hypothetical protein
MIQGLTTPSERFRQEVEPALADYDRDRLSERLANNLARAIDHHVDWNFQYYKAVGASRLNGAKDTKEFRATLLSQCPELQMMNDLSDAAHHHFLDRPNTPPRVIDVSTAAYVVQDGQLWVREYEKPYWPSATKAADFLRNWKD